MTGAERMARRRVVEAAERNRLLKIEKLTRQLMSYATPWAEDLSEHDRAFHTWAQLEKLLDR